MDGVARTEVAPGNWKWPSCEPIRDSNGVRSLSWRPLVIRQINPVALQHTHKHTHIHARARTRIPMPLSTYWNSTTSFPSLCSSFPRFCSLPWYPLLNVRMGYELSRENFESNHHLYRLDVCRSFFAPFDAFTLSVVTTSYYRKVLPDSCEHCLRFFYDNLL